MEHALRHILPSIAALGYEAFLVGGCVRDTFLGVPVSDVDIATNCPVPLLQEHFSIRADVSKNMAVTVLLLQSKEYSYEVAQLRGSEGLPTGTGCPASIHSTSPDGLPQCLVEDLARRDFTLNALALTTQGMLIDPFGGQRDMLGKQIRAVADPQKRFDEDALRMLRAVRFAVKYAFTLEPLTAETIQNNTHKLASIAPERIQQELTSMTQLGGKGFSKAIRMMLSLGILHHILPEIADLNNFEHSPAHHPEGNAFEHTLACLEQTDSTSSFILFAILCHDIGKPQTFSLKNNKPAYHGHDKAALPLIAAMAQRLRWSNNLLAHVRFVAENHMRFHAIPHMAPHKALSLMESPYYSTLHIVAWCDARARGDAFDAALWQAIEDRIAFLRHTFMGEKSPLTLLAGRRVMAVTGLKTGPLLGSIIAKTKEWIVNNTILDEESINKRLVQLAKSMHEKKED